MQHLNCYLPRLPPPRTRHLPLPLYARSLLVKSPILEVQTRALPNTRQASQGMASFLPRRPMHQLAILPLLMIIHGGRHRKAWVPLYQTQTHRGAALLNRHPPSRPPCPITFPHLLPTIRMHLFGTLGRL